MPPMPPPGMAGIGVSFLGLSATIASVVMSRPAIEAASCSAVRTTLVGSMIPCDTRFSNQQSDASPGENAFLNRGLRGMHGIVNAVLALFHLDLGCPADADHGNPARKLR